MNPPLYKRYRIRKEKESYDDIMPEIRLLHSYLNVEGYLNQPAKYMEHRKWIVKNLISIPCSFLFIASRMESFIA